MQCKYKGSGLKRSDILQLLSCNHPKQETEIKGACLLF